MPVSNILMTIRDDGFYSCDVWIASSCCDWFAV